VHVLTKELFSASVNIGQRLMVLDVLSSEYTVLYSTVQYSTVLYSTAQYCAVHVLTKELFSASVDIGQRLVVLDVQSCEYTVRYSTVQHGTAHCPVLPCARLVHFAGGSPGLNSAMFIFVHVPFFRFQVGKGDCRSLQCQHAWLTLWRVNFPPTAYPSIGPKDLSSRS